MKSLLFTGATGTIGTPLLRQLRANHPGLAIRVATPDQPPAEAGVEWIRTDFRDGGVDYDALVAGADVVFHLGAHTQPDQGDFDRVNVRATRLLAEAAERSGTVKYFMYTSSTMAYGQPRTRRVADGQRLTEGPYMPASYPLKDYSVSKYQSEVEIAAVQRTVKFAIIRPTLVADLGVAVAALNRLPAWRQFWKAGKTWHHLSPEVAAESLGKFALEETWARLDAISYMNLSDDSEDRLYFDIFWPRGDKRLRFVCAHVLPLIDQAKEFLKYRYVAPRWNYSLLLFSNERMVDLGIAPRRSAVTLT